MSPLLGSKYDLQVFSHSVGFLFTLDCVLWCAEVFRFGAPFVCFYAFVACAFGCHTEETIAKPVSSGVSPVCSSGSSIVSGLMFRSFIHFELIFVHIVR